MQGIGAAFLLVSNTPIVVAAFPKSSRATALGALSGMVYLGYSFGNFMGGIFTELWGWRSIFIVAAIGGSIAFTAIHFLVVIPEREADTGKESRSIDFCGILFYAVTLICLQTGATHMNKTFGPVLLLLCLIFFYIFIRHQLRSEYPIYDVNLLIENRPFAMANFAVFLNLLSTYGSQYLLALYLQCNRGLSPSDAGQISLLQPLMQLFFSPLAGMIADRISPSRVSFFGMGLITASLALLSRLTPDTHVAVIYITMALTGTGISFFSAPNTSIIMSAVPENKRGMAAASNSIMRNLGMQGSIIFCSASFMFTLGNTTGISPEQYGDMMYTIRFCFAAFTVLSAIGMIFSLKSSLKGNPL